MCFGGVDKLKAGHVLYVSPLLFVGGCVCYSFILVFLCVVPWVVCMM